MTSSCSTAKLTRHESKSYWRELKDKQLDFCLLRCANSIDLEILRSIRRTDGNSYTPETCKDYQEIDDVLFSFASSSWMTNPLIDKLHS